MTFVIMLISSLITGLMLLFAACGTYIRYRLQKAKEEARLNDQNADETGEGGGQA